MKASYRELFDEVRASQNLKEEVLNMTKQERTQVVKKVSLSFIIAAALAVLLAGTALAAAIGIPQTLQEWFGHQWTEAGGAEEMPKEQAEVIESLVQPVDVTSSGYGVTVTLDSVTPGENCLWMYLKVKGDMLEDEWHFINEEVIGEGLDHPMGMSIYPMSNTEEGKQDLVIQYIAPEGVTFLEGGRLILELSDLILLHEAGTEEGEGQPEYELVEGFWALPFILEPVEEQEMLTVERAVVPARDFGSEQPEGPMEIRDIRVTTTGVSFTEDEPDPEIKPELLMTDVTSEIFLQMKDGAEFQAVGRRRGLERTRCSWDFPVDLSKVESIRFGDVVIPLEKPKK